LGVHGKERGENRVFERLFGRAAQNLIYILSQLQFFEKNFPLRLENSRA
jgi:hypothetical protein